MAEGSCIDNARFLEVCGNLAWSDQGEDGGHWEGGQGVKGGVGGIEPLSSSLLVSGIVECGRQAVVMGHQTCTDIWLNRGC